MNRIQLLAERKAFASRKGARLILRGQLTESDKHDLDEDLALSFCKFTRNPDKDGLRHLQYLVGRGADTALFEDYEYSQNANYTHALDAWLYSSLKDSSQESILAEGFALVAEAGDACLRNRSEAGNGGAPFHHCVFDYLGRTDFARKDATQKDALLERVLYRICTVIPANHALWLGIFDSADQGLWSRIAERGGAFDPLQWRISKFLIELLVRPVFLEQTEDHGVPVETSHVCNYRIGDISIAHVIDAYLSSIQIIFSRQCFRPLLDELVPRIDAREGIFAFPDFDGRKIFPDGCINTFLVSRQSRRHLQFLLSSPALRQAFISDTAAVFKLVQSKERGIFLDLLRTSRAELLPIRNQAGQSLLHYACSVRGRTEELIKLFLQSGFDPEEKDHQGHSALDIARKQNDPKVLAALDIGHSHRSRAMGQSA